MAKDYSNVLNIISLILAIAILASVLFGCYFKRVERFTNIKKEEKKEEKKKLSAIEEKFLSEISDGKVDSKTITENIKEGKLTKKNIDNLIEHVQKEQFKNKKNKDD